MEQLRQTLASTPLTALTEEVQDIVTLEHSNTVEDALKVLAKNHILSAPLVVSPGLEDVESLEPGAEALAGPTLVGWIDVRDVLQGFIRYLHEHHHPGGRLPTAMLALMQVLEKHGPAFAAKTLITVGAGEDRGLVYQADAGLSVLAAVRDVFLGQQQQQQQQRQQRQPPTKSAGEGGEAAGGEAAGGGGGGAAPRVVHRLAIFDARGDITRVVSQLDVLRLLVKHEQLLGDCARQTVRELGLLAPTTTATADAADAASDANGSDAAAAPAANGGGRRLVTLEPNMPTLFAYERLAAAGVTGAPVVSADGELIANLSVSDIRGIQPHHFGVLGLPVAEFLAVKHQTTYLEYSAEHHHHHHHHAGERHPFFASGPQRAASGGMQVDEQQPQQPQQQQPQQQQQLRAPGADAADEEAAAANGGAAAHAQQQQQQQHRRRRSSSRRRATAAGDDAGVRLITCTPEATLSEVLRLLVDNDVHRVYVRVEGLKPCEVVGVVTPTDLLRLVSGWLPPSSKRGAADAADGGGGDAGGDAGAGAAAAAAAAGGGGGGGGGGSEAGGGDAKKAKVGGDGGSGGGE